MPIPYGMMGGMGGGGRGRGRGNGMNPWFVMMAIQLWQQIDRLPVKPPVTLAIMGLAAAIHFDMLGELGDLIVGPSTSAACLSARLVVERAQWQGVVYPSHPTPFVSAVDVYVSWLCMPDLSGLY